MQKRVVITGLGPVAAIGIGKNDFFKNLFNLQAHIIPIPDCFYHYYKFKSKFLVPTPLIHLKNFGINLSEKIIGNAVKISLTATLLALKDAGLPIDNLTQKIDSSIFSQSAIIIGTGIGNLHESFSSNFAHISNEAKKSHYNRMVIPITMPNSISAWISILLGITGENYTLNASCASGTYALGEAYHKIKNNEYNMIITGGIEALNDNTGSIMRGFDTLNALTHSENGYPYPFSEERSGFLFSEGAGCILILEELNHALNRNAEIYAEITGFEKNSDAFNIMQIDDTGKNICKLLNNLVKDKRIDYLNSHGTGTILNDIIEAKIIQTTFGNKETQPYINSTKGILGHTIGASGALEAAVIAYSIKNSIIHGNIIKTPLPNLNLVKDTIQTSINTAISTSYGFGGHNSAILCEAYH